MEKSEKIKQLLKQRWKKGGLVCGAMLAIIAGGLLVGQAQTMNKQKTNLHSVYPTPPDNTHVHYNDNSALLHIILEDGTPDPLTYLYLDDNTPVFCVGLAIPLASNSETAQKDATNQLLSKLTDEQKAILNNVAFLARQKGDMEGYAEGRLGIYYLLDQDGVAKHKAVDLQAIPGSPLQDMGKVKAGANALIDQAKKMRELPSFNNQTVPVVQGVSKTVTDTNGVLGNFPFMKNNVPDLAVDKAGNVLTFKADFKSKHGLVKNAIQLRNLDGNIPDDYTPYFIFSTAGDSTGNNSQSVLATQDPTLALTSLNVNIIGLGEFSLTKSSTNNAFSKALMAGAEFTVYTASDDKPVKLASGQAGYPITVTQGTLVDKTNLVLKMGTDALVGAKNLDNSVKYYVKETKAPAGFVPNDKKIPIDFNENSKFDTSDNNYQTSGAIQDIPTGSVSGTKVDADTHTITPQGSGDFKDIVYGAFWEDGTPMKWSDGVTPKTPDSSITLPIALTAGIKADDTRVAFKVDDKNNFGFQNVPLIKDKTRFYLQEIATSSGYSLSTTKVWIDLSQSNHVNVNTNDFDDSGVQAEDKAVAFNFMFEKAQDEGGSFPGLNGAVFEAKGIDGNKEKPVTVTSSPGTDASGYQVNGLTVFDGKANLAAGNPNPDGLAVGNWLVTEVQTPDGLHPINPFKVTTTVKKDKEGHPLSYHFEFTDTVTHQVITEEEVNADQLVDKNIAFKVDLGLMVDESDQPKVPEITTEAHSKDGDTILSGDEISSKTAMWDQVKVKNVVKGDQILSHLHRLVTDENGNVTSNQVVQNLRFVADDDMVKTENHHFDTTADTTKDFEVKKGSKVTYVFTAEDFDAKSDPKVDAPKATADDLEDKDETLSLKAIAPSIDIEKANGHTPDAGNGNHADKPNNIGVNDHDTADTYFEVAEKAKTSIYTRGTNNGTEALTDVKVSDKTIAGEVNVTGIHYTYKGKALTVDKTNAFELNGKRLVLQPGESVLGTGTLGALPDGELHGDKMTIEGVGVYTKQKVSDDDPWYGKVNVKPSTPPTPKSVLPTTGSSTGDALMYGGMAVLLVALGGTVYYMKKEKSVEK